MDSLHAVMGDRDYQEAITYSFVDPALQALLDPEAQALPLRNPISADMAVMRSTLWPGLLNAVRHNLNRQLTRVRLYEIGKRFARIDGQRREELVISACVTGTVMPPQWDSVARDAGFFDLKGDVEGLIGPAGDKWQFRPDSHPALHPGQTAEIVDAADSKRRMGWIGALHPEIQAKLGIDQPVILFELLVDLLAESDLPAFTEVSRFPSIRRDLAFVAPADLSFGRLLASTRRLAGGLLVDLKLFDLYQGEGIDSGRKSFALTLTLQDSSRTLKEDEIEALIGRVVAGVTAETGATLRK
jgi:phenylalanyl-tRNA synthetase beta chain